MALQYLDLEGLKRFWDNTQNYIDKADTEIKEDLEAKTADLQSKIDAITGGGGGSVPSLETLQTAINNEISRAEEAEKTLQENIDAEVLARTEADESLSERIDNLAASSDEGLADLRNEIYGEDVDTIPEEATLKAIKESLDDETGTNRPAAIQKAVDDITGTEGDSIDTLTLHGLKNLITHEAEESDGAVNELREEILGDSSLLSDGKIPSTHTLDSLEKRIEAEETRATSAEEVLQENITAEETRATAAESALQASVEKEIKDRTDADSALKAEIYGGEVPAEGLGNNTLTQLRSDLTAETSNREDSLTELEKRIYGKDGQVDADHTLTHLDYS